MAYTDDAVLAKLSALNESHDSIATAAQWFMFHRRHADRTVQLWLQRLKDSPSPKRLNLIYLANEVTQQSKARHKEDFVVAFSPVIAEATATAYQGASTDLQGKIRRVVDVWKDRSIFEVPIQTAIESRLDEIDRSRGVQKSAIGGSIFSSSSPAIPPELSPLVGPLQSVNKAGPPAKTSISSANTDYEKLTDPKNEPSSLPVHAARLNGLVKTLTSAENVVANSIKARRELVSALEKLLVANKSSLEDEENALHTLRSRKAEIDSKKQEVEQAIMRGLVASDVDPSGGNNPSASPAPEPDRPEMEALTPPHMQDEPVLDGDMPGPADDQADRFAPPAPGEAPAREPEAQLRNLPAPGIEMLSNLASQYQAVPVAVNGGVKRRRLDSSEDFPDLRGEGIDADVAEMIREDSLGQGTAAGH